MTFLAFTDYMKVHGWSYRIPIGAIDSRDSRRAIFCKRKGRPDEPIIVPIRNGIVPDEIIERLRSTIESTE